VRSQNALIVGEGRKANARNGNFDAWAVRADGVERVPRAAQRGFQLSAPNGGDTPGAPVLTCFNGSYNLGNTHGVISCGRLWGVTFPPLSGAARHSAVSSDINF